MKRTQTFVSCATLLVVMDAGAADNQTVAAFLIARPPIGYLGWGWVRPP